MKCWCNGKILSNPVPLDSFNYTLHYSAPSAWEGIRSYVQDDGTCVIWKLRDHCERLKDSAKILGFEIPYTVGEIEQACRDLVTANGNGNFYLRPIAYSTLAAEGIHQAKQTISLDIYCVPVPKLHGKSGKEIKMVISNLVRSYPQYQMQAKTPANYQVVQLAQPIMKQTGVDDIFLIDAQGYVVEATVANFFVFKGDVAMTPPNRGSILPGITRRCVAEILNDRSLMFSKYKKAPMVIEKDITRSDIYTADCIILCGTFAEIVKVKEVDGRQIDGNQFYADMLKTEYDLMVRGRR